MLRCLQTTSYGLVPLGIPVIVKPNFYELGGMWNLQETFPGMTRKEISDLYPDYNAEQVPNNGYYFKNYRETRIEGYQRAREIITEFYSWTEESVAVVIHGLLTEAIIYNVFTDCGLEPMDYVELHNCGISLLERVDGKYHIKFINNQGIIE